VHLAAIAQPVGSRGEEILTGYVDVRLLEGDLDI
jgi:hypothetical protein